MKKVVSLVLSALMLGSIAACTTTPSNSVSNGNSSVENTDYKLVENGKSAYKLVVADEKEGMNEEVGAWEVQELFKEATSIELEIVYESDVTYSKDSKLIIMGDTKFTEEADVEVSKIPHDGFVLKTVDSNVFVLGESMGVVYGGYELLAQTVGYEYFVSGVYSLDKGRSCLYQTAAQSLVLLCGILLLLFLLATFSILGSDNCLPRRCHSSHKQDCDQHTFSYYHLTNNI